MSRHALLFLLLAASACAADADTYLVLPDGTGDFPTIQTAIDSSANGDIILLGDGTFTGDGNRDISYAGKEITIRSESDSPVDCIIDCQGSSSFPHRGFICTSGETALSKLRGITVTGGYMEGFSTKYTMGGGAYLEADSPFEPVAITIENCVFRDNSARGGGAVFCGRFVYASFIDCVFEANEARMGGATGGMYCSGSGSPQLTRCTFVANLSSGFGAFYLTSPILEDCDFTQHAQFGLYLASLNSGITCEITNCRFFGNAGGGMYLIDCADAPAIHACSFWDNEADEGGGLRLTAGSSVLVTDCLFYDNRAIEGGGVLWCEDDCSAAFSNCTMAYNQAGTGAG
ncbi:MAG: right-handed parallel beta-helix repeat-containing protein, partial [Candidatus Eisenbacteria sp.]|nr:right-handed parallel beta-helix repeat-containing protein [Candidatus Eisenbacteria bacterium]